jgi:hypothetical protein
MTLCRRRLYRQRFGGLYWLYNIEKMSTQRSLKMPITQLYVNTPITGKHDRGKTKKVIVATELKTVNTTNFLSAQHNYRKIRGSYSGVAEGPLPVGSFSVTSVKVVATSRTVLLHSSSGYKDCFVLKLPIRRCFEMLITICQGTQYDIP